MGAAAGVDTLATMRLRFAGLIAIVSALSVVTLSFSACGGSDPRPDAGSTNTNGTASSSSSSSGSTGDDSGAADGGGDAAVRPQSCKNTIKDGNETDVDCGGNECERCIDGKSCVQPNDCKGGSCVQNKCVTAACGDKITNGDESDTDCGGTVCAKCTIGKRCKAGEDCVSGNCTNDFCACPAGMAVVSKASGGAYCIDAVEVTKGQYNKFLTANVPVQNQSVECLPPANPTFVPRGAWPPAQSPDGLAFTLSLPVHYVDWCDAYAYCQWAGKQLCGKINGGSITAAEANDSSQDAWFNACSAQGTKQWPYGTGYIGSKCNGTGIPVDGGAPIAAFGKFENQDDGVYTVVKSDDQGNFTAVDNPACQGGSVGLFQMSGNVAEWEDSCDGNTATSQCRLRGGSYTAADTSATLECAAVRTEQRQPTDGNVLKDVGIRCCLY